jgi:hypothetical protein
MWSPRKGVGGWHERAFRILVEFSFWVAVT